LCENRNCFLHRPTLHDGSLARDESKSNNTGVLNKLLSIALQHTTKKRNCMWITFNKNYLEKIVQRVGSGCELQNIVLNVSAVAPHTRRNYIKYIRSKSGNEKPAVRRGFRRTVFCRTGISRHSHMQLYALECARQSRLYHQLLLRLECTALDLADYRFHFCGARRIHRAYFAQSFYGACSISAREIGARKTENNVLICR
jgi:hypothetical protein